VHVCSDNEQNKYVNKSMLAEPPSSTRAITQNSTR